ncbi:D-alanyl-D-alanine carboxypeptidase DacF [Bacillus thuringiensis serovar morrisoni str. 4AA1]|uniref:serine-type D-Ala-D-Ala carboxypeptidase DacF n=1 Tax=Bacillus TaxID=1386 RepID=UPI0005CE02E5|nr:MULTISPECIES: serine-type D-Ala-D-Ala carboxypeptidase DacF [Bacillus]AJQ60799.1 D-alanyl-D-alanine carboxypeptidase [Bacillus thuringiensis serovar morrisoni]MED3097964.1 serine-type D-Ala-D-Ala carboxypeptidase DacF [Bacillus thuringiensis]MRA94421.1 serine-type D-Ala-D-Ala carboxypeptidase DacF [Bacillus thuringiensis]OTY43755.1 D-alanyl-D-alanine carboxypeptidase [Bacillus thuringiensis serovar poloniensis]RNG52677.1 serine-type D-Ala-D-Ala carboxypeptidase DacF [Bacillus thuringiensis]
MKRVFGILVCFMLLLSGTSVSFAQSEKTKQEKTVETTPKLAEQASSAIVIEQDTGKVLFDKNPNEKLPPASMTKIMTMLLIMEQVEKGKLKLTDKVRASEHAASMGGSQIFLEPGEEMTVNEMLKGIAIASGNDASVAVAEHIAGSEEGFVNMMNKKAKDLGLKNTHFQNPTGLPAKDHYSTANDMAIMARELMKYPLIRKYTGKYEDYLREDTDKKFWLVNTNKLVRFYPGVDGVKTGFTTEAKYCLTASAQKNGMRVISVVMGAPTSKERNNEVTKLLDYAFGQYMTKKLYTRGEKIKTVQVGKGKKEKIDLVASDNVSLLMKKGESMDKVKQEVIAEKKVKAPIKKGDALGTLVIKKDKDVLLKQTIVAKEDVAAASWWELFKRSFGMFSTSK